VYGGGGRRGGEGSSERSYWDGDIGWFNDVMDSIAAPRSIAEDITCFKFSTVLGGSDDSGI